MKVNFDYILNSLTERNTWRIALSKILKLDISYQPILVSGTSIKTINSETLLGSGNIAITVPDQLSDLTDDTTHRLVTDTEKGTWNGKQDAIKLRSYQTLVSAGTLTMDTTLGLSAIITLGHDVSLTISNLVNGDEGNIIVVQGTPDHTLTIVSPSPAVINNGQGAITLTTGVGAKTIISYSYDGTDLYITYGPNYTKAS